MVLEVGGSRPLAHPEMCRWPDHGNLAPVSYTHLLSRHFPASLIKTYTCAIISRLCAGCKQIPLLGPVSTVYSIPCSSEENGIAGISKQGFRSITNEHRLSTVGLINRLAASGYVRRHRGDADRREVLVVCLFKTITLVSRCLLYTSRCV